MFIKNNKLYMKILIYLTSSVLFTLLITSSILYKNFENIVLKQVYSKNLNILLQTGRGVTTITNMAKTISNQIYKDLNVAHLLYYSDPNAVDIRVVDEQLTNYRLSIPFIDSVYVYNQRQELFYINAGFSSSILRETIQSKHSFDDRDVIKMIDNFKEYKPSYPIPRKYLIDDIEKITKSYYTFLLYDVFSKNKIGSAIIVNISTEWITNFINNSSNLENSTTFILNKRNIVVSDSDIYPMLTNLSKKKYIKKIVGNSGSGYFIDEIDGEKSLVTYTGFDDYNWKYINITPWKNIFREVEDMVLYTVIIAILLLVLGLVIALVLTQNLYVPIDLFMKKNISIMRNKFLTDLLLNRSNLNEKFTRLKLKELGIKFNISSYYSVLLVKIDNYGSFQKKHVIEEREIIQTAVSEIILVNLVKKYKVQIVDMKNDGLVIILNIPALENDFSKICVDNDLLNCQRSIREKLNITVSISVSPTILSISGLSQCYQEVIEVSLYRLFSGYNSLIYFESLEKLKQSRYQYPDKIEKKLICSLMSGQIDKVKKNYDDIIETTKEFPISVFNLAISHLTLTVGDAINTINKNNLLSQVKIDIFASKLIKAEIIEDVASIFYSVFDEIHNLLCNKKRDRYESLIQKIDKYIDNEYSNPDFYIEMLSEDLNLTSTYLSHIYKQYRSITILDKITQIRMDAARKLLLNSKKSISEIAKETGYSSSSYFFRVFKKINGSTPSSFRKQRRN